MPGAFHELRTPPRLRWLCLAAAALLSLAPAAPTVLAKTPRAREYALKAVFLNKLVAFVTWPEPIARRPDRPLRIGVLGDAPFDGALEQAVESRRARGEVVQILRSRVPEELRSCHLIFIAESERSRLCEHLRVLEPYPILTVSDIEGFSARGGILTLVMSANRVRLQVNPRAYKDAGLTISAKLLAFSEEVQEHACR